MNVKSIDRFRVAAAPFINQEMGVQVITTQGAKSFQCHRHYLSRYPEYSNQVTGFIRLIEQAQQIYLLNVQGAAPDTVERHIKIFKDRVASIQSGSPGSQVLVWACFIMALSCQNEEYQSFFYQYLESQHRRCGFGNLAKALEYLKMVWDQRSQNPEKWSLSITRVGTLVF